MGIVTIFAIIVGIVVAVLLIKLLGKALSFAFSVAGIVLVVWLVVAGMRLVDTNNVQNNFLEENNLFILTDDGDMLTGFATQGGEVPVEEDILTNLDNPNSELYEDFYKVITVDKSKLPQKTALLVEVSADYEKRELFKEYIESTLLSDNNVAENLVEAEKEGDIEVHKETLAFRHGVKDVITP